MTAKQQQTDSIETKFSNLQGKHLILKKDDILYKQNDPSDSLYLVLKGLIEVRYSEDKNNSISRSIKKDEFLGIEDVLKDEVRSDTAVALEDSELLKIKLIDYYKEQPVTIQKELLKSNITNNISMSFSNSSAVKNLYGIYEVKGKKVISFFGHRGNISNAIVFKNALFAFIDEGNINLIIDLLACKTIDSTFLGGLIASLKKATSRNGNLKLVCDKNICSWLFVMTKMDKVFKIYDTVEEAIADWN